jgi:flagellar hook-length control protein FliK
MPANVLALFAVKAPVEPTAPTQDQANDNGFKDFMDTAVHKVDTAQKPSKEDSPQNQNNTQAEKTQPKAKTRTEDNSNNQEVSAAKENESQSAPETVTKDSPIENTVTKDSLIEDTEVLATQLQELDINQAQFEALLGLLGLNGDADIDALLQSLTQALNLNPKDSGGGTNASDLIARIQQNQGEAVNLLKQAGLSDAEVKNFLNHLQSLQNASAQTGLSDAEVKNFLNHLQSLQNASTQKGLDKNADLQAKLDSQTNRPDEAIIKNSVLDNSQAENDEGPDFLTQLKDTAKLKDTTKRSDTAKGTGKTDRSASLDKLTETAKQNEATRITTQEPVNEKGAKTSNLGELLSGKNAQANILQTESFTDGKGYKGLETAKTGPDLQIQSPTVAANTAVKAAESSKPILPENLLARGATEAKIINQIANKMTVRTIGAQNEVHIKLDPPSLGTVRMKIITSGDTVRTVIVAENQAVKQVIENNFNQLRDALGEQGLKLGSFTVTVGGESGHQHPSGESLDEENNTSLFEKTASNDTDENPETGMVSLFFGDNQSISVIA